MNTLRGKLILIVLGLALFACTPTTLEKVLKKDSNVPKKERPATSEEIQAVKIIRQEEEITAKLKMQLKSDDEFTTDADTMVVILFPGKAEVLVKSNTHVKITQSIFVFSGEIYVKTKGSFEVETKYAKIIREGTEFLVTVTLRAEVSVVVLEGRVGLRSKSHAIGSVSLARYERGRMVRNFPPVNEGRIATRSIIENILSAVKPVNPVAYTPDIIPPDYARGICTVPDVTNMEQSRAQGFLQTAGFTVIKVLHKRFSQHGDWVHSQDPLPHSAVRCETEIQLTTAAK